MQNDHQFFFRLEILAFLYAFDEACHRVGKSEKKQFERLCLEESKFSREVKYNSNFKMSIPGSNVDR